MSYQTEILLLSFLVSTIVALIVIPLLRRLKVGQIERDDGPQSHLKKQGTPTMGRYNNDYINSYTNSCNVYSTF